MSAPASTYYFALLIVPSIPSILLASVLAQITNYPSEHLILASFANFTFFTNTSVETNFLPSKCPHLFGNT